MRKNHDNELKIHNISNGRSIITRQKRTSQYRIKLCKEGTIQLENPCLISKRLKPAEKLSSLMACWQLRLPGHRVDGPRDKQARRFHLSPEIGIKAQRDSINRRQIFNYKRKSCLVRFSFEAEWSGRSHSNQPPSAFLLAVSVNLPLNATIERGRGREKKEERTERCGKGSGIRQPPLQPDTISLSPICQPSH